MTVRAELEKTETHPERHYRSRPRLCTCSDIPGLLEAMPQTISPGSRASSFPNFFYNCQ